MGGGGIKQATYLKDADPAAVVSIASMLPEYDTL